MVASLFGAMANGGCCCGVLRCGLSIVQNFDEPARALWQSFVTHAKQDATRPYFVRRPTRIRNQNCQLPKRWQLQQLRVEQNTNQIRGSREYLSNFIKYFVLVFDWVNYLLMVDRLHARSQLVYGIFCIPE